MSRLGAFVANAVNNVHRAQSKAMTEIREACDDASRWIDQYAKDKQCDDKDREEIAFARAEVERVRKLRLT